MNIIVKNIGEDSSSLNGKSGSPNNILTDITRSLLLNSIHKRELFALPIIMQSVYLSKLRIYCVVMFLIYSGMEQYLHTNT